MTKVTLKALLLVFFLSFSLGLSSNKSIHKNKNTTQQSRAQSSLTSKNSSSRVARNSNHKKTSSRNKASTKTRSQNYPPPPEGKRKLPKPILDYIQDISDLCKIDSFEEQLQSMEAILKGLRGAMSFYNTRYPYHPSTGHADIMMLNLVEDVHMRVVWKPMLARQHRMDVAGQFLLVHSDLYNISSISGDVILLAHDWAEPIYRGLHCLSRGAPTKERIIIYKD